MREQVAQALVNKGITLGTLNRSEEAAATFSKVIETFRDDKWPSVQEAVALAIKLRSGK